VAVKFGLSTIGGLGAPPPPTPEDEIRQRRIASARACPSWSALDPGDLVERGNGHFLVSASDDSVYTRYAGAVWNALGGIAHSEANPLYFVVQDGNVHLFEKYPWNWSEIVRASAHTQTRSR
jgi:hypothetical protein